MTGNYYGIWWTGTGNIIIRNTAHDTSFNYQLAAGNAFGLLQGFNGSFSTSEPWTNLSY